MEPAGERIRVAAVELFAERGFHGTGIRDLAVRAGLSSATLYHYMGTKEDLLVRIMTESLQRLLTAGRQITEQGSPAEQMVGLVGVHVLTHATWRLETRVVDGEMRALSAGRHVQVVDLRDAYEEIWQQTIEAGHRARVFRVRDSRLARLALLQMCSGVAHWYQPHGPVTLADLARGHAEMALGLLGATPMPDQALTESVHRSSDFVATNWPAQQSAVPVTEGGE
jgi:AcrR family transcriptional regulator